MSNYRYYIINTYVPEVVMGTNNTNVALEYAANSEMIVIDTTWNRFVGRTEEESYAVVATS